MQAIAKVRPERGLSLISIDEPAIRPGQVLVRVKNGAVCGTDLHIFNWDAWAQGRIRPPRVIGHEFCGEIIAVGEGVTDRQVGQFVASESHIVDLDDPDLARGLGHVASTTRILGVDVDGGFAPFAAIPAANARPVPSSVPQDVAAMLDALGNAVHTVMDGPVEGCDVLITGLGPIGLFSIAICKVLGARRIIATEVSPYRIGLAEALGADIIVDPSKTDASVELRRIAPRGVDATLEMSGHPSSLGLAIEATRPGGRISLLGVFPESSQVIDVNAVVFKALNLRGIVGRRLWETWEQMMWLFEERGLNVSSVVTHHMPFTDFESAMDVLNAGMAGKVVLEF